MEKKRLFLQYQENPGNDAYMYYTHVREDGQYDDLTLLGIKRKEIKKPAVF
ncbi:hypothetical protein FACS1894109_12210 [Spirochaetia bacterium]|nr:hypothetical protein FACS1894109_12210 [Spirochaetia bacterium]